MKYIKTTGIKLHLHLESDNVIYLKKGDGYLHIM